MRVRAIDRIGVADPLSARKLGDKVAEARAMYETKTVRAVRGMESRALTRWEADGWELVSQTPGTLQTSMIFRRPKPRTRLIPFVVGGVILAATLATIITFGIIGERTTAVVPTSTAAATPSATSNESSATSPGSSTAARTQLTPGPEIVSLTPENDPDLAALLAVTDYCDPSIERFAEAHRGQTIDFAGSIDALGPHGSATTRYDILLSAGDFSQSSALGPAFQFRDVNTTSDLNFVGDAPDTIGVGTNLNVSAEVVAYEPSSCLFLLDPASTEVR